MCVCVCVCIYKCSKKKSIIFAVYRVFGNSTDNACEQIERIKLSRKVPYYFAIFAIVYKILIIKNCRILVFNNFFLKYYQLYKKTSRNKNYLFSSHIEL